MFYDESNGTYSIKVKPGDYVLVLVVIRVELTISRNFTRAIYDPKKATKITVAEDETKTINFKLYPELDIRPDYFEQNPDAQQIKLSGTITYEEESDGGSSSESINSRSRAIPKRWPDEIPAAIYTLTGDLANAG